MSRRTSSALPGIIAALAALAALVISISPAFASGRCAGRAQVRRPLRVALRAVAERPKALRAAPSLELVQAQGNAGYKIKDLGRSLEDAEFTATALDGLITARMNGVQELTAVEVADGALAAAGGHEELSKALLGAIQEAFSASQGRAKDEIWSLYRNETVLLEAPLSQIGAGSTALDLWANVTRDDETLRLAEEVFVKFDADKNGFWNLKETAAVQMATEGTEMTEEAFNSLILAAAPNGGKDLSEDDLAVGLSKEQVIELYTNAQRQKQLGFVLDIRKDHAIIFSGATAAAAEPPAPAEGAAEAASPSLPPELD